MGAQRVLQAAPLTRGPARAAILAIAAGALVLLASAATAAAQPRPPLVWKNEADDDDDGEAQDAAPAPAPKRKRDRVAVIDLGPGDGAIRARLAAGVVAAGLEPVIGDGVEDALAGIDGEQDAVELAAALAEAQRAFGALACDEATAAGKRAGGIAAARQAAGLAVPELARAWTYVLLCADRRGDHDTAVVAAARIAAAGGSPDAPADVLRKYPEVDAVLDRELVELTITADAPGADIWIDHRFAGKAPLTVVLPVGEHVLAAAAGSRRGWAAGTAVPAQTQLVIPTTDQGGAWSEVARRVASWRGQLPPPEELGWVLAKVRARVALIRRGDHLEAWGRAGLAEKPYQLGGADATGSVSEAARLLALIHDRVQVWSDRAPDPDRPLLVEGARGSSSGRRKEPPTRWWVYAAIAGAVGASIAIIWVHDGGTDRQRVELHYPLTRPEAGR